MNTLLDIIKEIECLLWAVVILVALYMVLKYCCLPIIQLYHERKMKADAFEREKEWYFIKKVDQPFEEELKKYKEELTELKKKEEELNKGTDSLKNDKEQFEKEILMAKIKAYEEIIKTINK